MGILSWIIVGVVAGFLAKMVTPRSEPEESGFLGVMLLGVVGAVIGGWVWNVAYPDPASGGMHFGVILAAFAGAVIVIGVLRVLDRQASSY